MINSNVSTKMGAKFRLANTDKITGEITRQSDWYLNAILDVATINMENGFNAIPIPRLGSSIVDVTTSQTGVQAPINTMQHVRDKVLWEGTFTRESSTKASVSWGHQYTYRNNGTSDANVSEIGIDNFNRAVFKDENDVIRSWAVSPTENLIVDMEFVITFMTPVEPISVSIIDNDGVVTGTLDVHLYVAPQVSNGIPQWYRILGNPNAPVKLVKDPNFNGLVKPADAQVIETSMPITYDYNGRQIDITIQHRGAVGGQSIKGMLVEFGALTPVFSVVFSTPIRIGSGYTFKSTMSVTW